jgi:hypothetical protein
MTTDRAMADMLGEPPRGPDPGFRIDVFARMAARARRRAAIRRAARLVALFFAIGLFFPVAKALGLTWSAAQPLLIATGLMAGAYLLAALTIEGPRLLLAWPRALLRGV